MRQRKRFMPVSAASGSIHDMLGAFEDKLDEVGGSTNIQASYDPVFRDVDGAFGEPGATITFSEIRSYWNAEHNTDPVLEEYDSFNAWWADTQRNYTLEEVDGVEGCGNIQAATIEDMLTAFEDKLSELGASTKIQGSAILGSDIDDQIWDIAQRYTTSSPVSGNWDNEPAHLLKAIIEETGLSEGEAKSKMISVLGWDPREVYQLSPLEASTSIQAADEADNIGEDYIKNLMDNLIKEIKDGSKTEYEVDNQKGNILLTSVSREGIIVEYTIPIADLQGDLKTDLDYILKAMKE